MKLTDELLDDMDCVDLDRKTGIETPEYIRRLIEERKARRAAGTAAHSDAEALRED